MPAIRIIDDHVELANIGTNTHAQIDSHIANPSAHHTKYTDANAVAAVAAADDYVDNTGDTIVLPTNSSEIVLDEDSMNPVPSMTLNSHHATYNGKCQFKPGSRFFWTIWSGTDNVFRLRHVPVASYPGTVGITDVLEITKNAIDMKGLPIKDQKNHAASALSGTKKLVEIDIGGASYYFEVYPTKA